MTKKQINKEKAPKGDRRIIRYASLLLLCVITKAVCAAIMKVLLPKYIQLPSGEELKKVVEAFRDELGFPQCAGVVDGTYSGCLSNQMSC